MSRLEAASRVFGLRISSCKSKLPPFPNLWVLAVALPLQPGGEKRSRAIDEPPTLSQSFGNHLFTPTDAGVPWRSHPEFRFLDQGWTLSPHGIDLFCESTFMIRRSIVDRLAER